LLKPALRCAFAALFIGSGVLHFVKHEGYVRLMPPALPYPHELVYLSGVIEGGLGALLLGPRTRRVAAWALVPTLIAIFPANVHAALTAGTDREAMPGVPVWAAWVRLPMQGVLIAWAYRYTRPE
jgi:uncharacterized membrane protein